MYPKDKYLIPVAVPAITLTVIALNNDPLPRLVSQGWFWRDAAAGVAITAFIWLCIRFISIRLDKKAAWKTAFYKRLLLQTVFGWLLPSVLLFGLCWAMFEFIIGQSIFDTFFPQYEFPFSVLLLAGINAYYLIYALLAKDGEQPHIFGETPQAGTLFAYKGADMYPLLPQMIRLVVKTDAGLDIHTEKGERLSMSGTLEGLEKSLPADVFFRANRQVIIHVRAIKSFRPAENGKIEINCLPDVEPPVVSQKKAAEFRKWLEQSYGA